MRRISILILVSLVLVPPPGREAGLESRLNQNHLRVAFIGFAPTAASEQKTTAHRDLEAVLEGSFKRDSRIRLSESSVVRTALAGLGYDGSINLAKDEARRLGAAVGCDFFVTGKTETLTRSERKGEAHQEAYAAVMIVDGRTGALAVFDFILEKAATRDAAIVALAKSLEARAASYVERMSDYSAARVKIKLADDESSREPVEDLPAEGSPQSTGFTAPQFLNRVRPEYTEEAGLADINATVEAKAVFRANGAVGEVEIIRWAGFGLDQSAERAIRGLKFKPATRDGRAISVRALVQYNFRRL